MFEEQVSSPSLAGSPPPPPPPGDVGAHIVKTYLELDVRHKPEYITVAYNEDEGRWCWTCMCQDHTRTLFVWYGRKRMKTHVEGNAHVKFLEKPYEYIFNPGQMWIDDGLDPAMLVLEGTNNSRATCKYCDASFPSGIDTFRKHITGMRHMINVSKTDVESKEPLPPIRKRERSHDQLDDLLLERSAKLIGEGRFDNGLEKRIWERIDDKVFEQKVDELVQNKILSKLSKF